MRLLEAVQRAMETLGFEDVTDHDADTILKFMRDHGNRDELAALVHGKPRKARHWTKAAAAERDRLKAEARRIPGVPEYFVNSVLKHVSLDYPRPVLTNHERELVAWHWRRNALPKPTAIAILNQREKEAQHA